MYSKAVRTSGSGRKIDVHRVRFTSQKGASPRFPGDKERACHILAVEFTGKMRRSIFLSIPRTRAVMSFDLRRRRTFVRPAMWIIVFLERYKWRCIVVNLNGLLRNWKIGSRNRENWRYVVNCEETEGLNLFLFQQVNADVLFCSKVLDKKIRKRYQILFFDFFKIKFSF